MSADTLIRGTQAANAGARAATTVTPAPFDQAKLHAVVMQAMTDLAACGAGFMTNLGHKLVPDPGHDSNDRNARSFILA